MLSLNKYYPGILHYRLSPDAPLAIRPTTESFNYVLRAWTRCRKEMLVAGKVMNLVLRMERIQKDVLLAEEKGVDADEGDWSWKRNISPNTKTYTMALDGWIIKAGLKAEKWRSKQLERNNFSKQRVRSGKSWEPPAGADGRQDDGTQEMEKAETVLKYIHDLDCIGQADVFATVIAYNILLSGWARLANEIRQDVPLKSEKLLHDMIALAEKGNENAAPDVTVSTGVVCCGYYIYSAHTIGSYIFICYNNLFASSHSMQSLKRGVEQKGQTVLTDVSIGSEK